MTEPLPDANLLPARLTAVEAAATVAFALSGLLEAARKRLDAVGVCVVAMGVRCARHFAPIARAMQWPGARGLGLCSAGGTQLALVTDFRLPQGASGEDPRGGKWPLSAARPASRPGRAVRRPPAAASRQA